MEAPAGAPGTPTSTSRLPLPPSLLLPGAGTTTFTRLTDVVLSPTAVTLEESPLALPGRAPARGGATISVPAGAEWEPAAADEGPPPSPCARDSSGGTGEEGGGRGYKK